MGDVGQGRLAALVVAAWFAGCTPTAPEGAPNLLLISVDTLRADTLACYGGEPTVGAALCGIAGRGARYVWAFATAPSTAPSVASLLTSRYPTDHGVTQFATTTLSGRVETVAEVLADAGWSTAAFVSNPVLHPARKLGQGFDTYDAKMSRREGSREVREREARATTDAAVAWVRQAREPWFLWIHYQDPHGPYEPPNARPLRRDEGEKLPALKDHSGYRGIPAYQVLPDLSGVASYERRYRDEVRYLDIEVGRLLADVEAASSPPAVLLTADHGEAFGEDDHYFAHGHSVGIEQIRIPLLWRPPGGAERSVVTTPVSNVDVAPTLLQAAGIPAPAEYLGRPLPLTDAGATDPARPLFAEHRARAAVVRGDRYYARDRVDLGSGVRDRVTGGLLHPLPPRTATLGADGKAPRYDTEARADDLEAALREQLEGAPALATDGGRSLADADREALEALGYLE